MAKPNPAKNEPVKTETAIAESSSTNSSPNTDEQNPPSPAQNLVKAENSSSGNSEDIDDILNSLKALLSAVEKLQKIRQEAGDIKPLIQRMLDGELVAGEELEQLKTGVSALGKLVKAYSDHQQALEKAQSARNLLDQVLK